MSESDTNTPKPQPSVANPPAEVDVKANLGKMPLVEKILGLIALGVVGGWIYVWSRETGAGLSDSRWFAPLSFVGSLAVTSCVTLKLFGVRVLHPRVEKLVLPIASLLPIVGYLIWQLSSVASCLTVGGSIALAYVSATTYWRKHIPEFAKHPLDDADKDKDKAEKTAEATKDDAATKAEPADTPAAGSTPESAPPAKDDATEPTEPPA